jgi:hypothetical protein
MVYRLADELRAAVGPINSSIISSASGESLTSVA